MSVDARATAARWLAERRPAAVVEVVQALGSVPRGVGTRMVVAAGDVAGTIGGGHLEWKAIDEARSLLRAGAAPRAVHYPLGPALGQCCGGAVTLRFAALDGAELAAWADEPPLFHLQLHGAGHVGRAIARLLAAVACRVDWIDERDDEFPRELLPGAAWPAHIRRIAVDAVEGEVRFAPAGAFYLVLTHSHDLDLRISEAILERGDFGWFGLIGSATKRARFVHRFEQRGVATEAIARMTCPIGVAGIPGKQPEVIALAVAAQLLQAASAPAARPAGARASISSCSQPDDDPLPRE